MEFFGELFKEERLCTVPENSNIIKWYVESEGGEENDEGTKRD